MHKDCKSKHAVDTAIILFAQCLRLSLLFFFVIERSVSRDGISLLKQRHVRKGNDAKNPAILEFFHIIKRTQLNEAHAQLLEKLRPIAFSETCRFLTIQEIFGKK